jgi:protein TonB
MMVPPPLPPAPPPAPASAPKSEPAWVNDGRVYAFVPEPLPEEQPARARWIAAAQQVALQHKLLWIVTGASLLLGAGALALLRANGFSSARAVPQTSALASVTAVTAHPAHSVARPAAGPLPRTQLRPAVPVAKPEASVSEKAQSGRSTRRAPERAAERPSPAPAPLASLQRPSRPTERAEERSPARQTLEPVLIKPLASTPALVAPAPVPAHAVSSAAQPGATAVRSASPALDREPVAIKRVKPEFPARARRMRLDRGRVTADLTIDRHGVVQHATIVDADPKGVFDDAVIRAVRAWTYKPKLMAGVPVDAHVRVTVQFVEDDR